MSLQEALLSLAGLSTGDAFGELFFGMPVRAVLHGELPPGPWRWTDDTHMALSIVSVLAEFGRIKQDALAQAFARRFHEQPWRGYAGGASRLLQKIGQGAEWRTVAPTLFGGGSFGNGGAMRAAPIGGFFAGDPARAADEARLSAEVTHAHPDGQSGAMAVAAAAAIAATNSDPQIACPRGVDFLQQVLLFVPPSLTRQGIERALEIAPDDQDRAVAKLGTGDQVSAQDTVPFCLWCAAYHLDDYPAALWQTALGLGDVDTTCAIVGGITALSARNIPAEWLRRREPLPEGFEVDRHG